VVLASLIPGGILWSRGSDLDGDTVPDAVDNCATVANGDQADGDMDGMGDVCDGCPTVPAPSPAILTESPVLFLISPDSSTVVFISDHETQDVFELFSIPVTGGPLTKLGGPLVEGGQIVDFSLASDSTKVVYSAKQTDLSGADLFVVPTTGGAPTQLSSDVRVVDFAISANNAMVAYSAMEAMTAELFSVPMTGGAPMKLSGPLVAGGNVVPGFTISPDSSRVLYRADDQVDGSFNLFSASLSGDSTLQMNPWIPAVGTVFDDFRISPDGSRVIFRIDVSDHARDDGRIMLYATALAGGPPVLLNDPLVPGGRVLDFLVSPISPMVVYRADQEADGVFELFSVPLDGYPVVRLNAPLVPGGAISHGYQISPDGSRVVYTADQDTDSVSEIYAVPITGGTPTRLSDTLSPGGDLGFEFGITPDFAHVIAIDGTRAISSEEGYLLGAPLGIHGVMPCPGGLSDDDSGAMFFYLVRPLRPFCGEWGRAFNGRKRIFACSNETICRDGKDGDADGLADCLDPDCNGVAGCEFPNELSCNDRLDNDADGLVDCDDPDCEVSCVVLTAAGLDAGGGRMVSLVGSMGASSLGQIEAKEAVVPGGEFHLQTGSVAVFWNR
jgi:Tol biopolymer transport system component